MVVVDEHGQRLGTVRRLRLGYPDAVTPGQDDGLSSEVDLVIAPIENTGGSSSLGAATRFLISDSDISSLDIPDELRLELLRGGFIELDTPKLRGPARYIHGDRIAEVTA